MEKLNQVGRGKNFNKKKRTLLYTINNDKAIYVSKILIMQATLKFSL